MAEDKTLPTTQESNDFWSTEKPKNAIQSYDNSLDDDYENLVSTEGTNIPSNNSNDFWSPNEPVAEPDVQAMENGWMPEERPAVAIDEDMGHLEKIGKSLMVGVGDMVDSFGDIADFVGGSPSSDVSKQVFGVETDKPISDAFHDFADYLHSYGDDVPGLTDLQDITWDDLSELDFWETGVARMLPFALSLMVPATAAAKGASLLTKGKTFMTASKAIAAGGRSIGISSNVSNALNASRLIKTGISTVSAGATSNMIEGAAIAGQAMNEAILQGISVENAKHVGRQVFTDNLASMAADIVQYGLFMGQMKVGTSLGKTAKGAIDMVAKTGAGKVGAKVAGKAGATAAGKATLKTLKHPKINSVIKTAFKSIGMGAANGITDGVVEQFQEVFQDWTVQRRIAEAKGEEFPSYLEFFTADEQIPTRVLSFATSLLMSGSSNMISTATENRATLAQSLDDRAETHNLLKIFNEDLDAGVYTVNRKTKVQEEVNGKMEWVEKDNIVEMNSEQVNMLAKDTAARTILMNAVINGDSDVVMEFFQAKFESKKITEEQLNIYKDTLAEVETSVKDYPVHKLTIDEKRSLVSHAWFNNVASKSLNTKREEMEVRIQEIESLVESKAQTKEWADSEIAGLRAAVDVSIAEDKKITEASSQAVRDVYAVANNRIAKDKFEKETAPKLNEIVQKEYKGEELTEEESKLVKDNKKHYTKQKEGYAIAQSFIKLSEHVGDGDIKAYGKGIFNKDGSTDFGKKLKDGKIEYVNVAADGKITTTIVDSAAAQAEKELAAEAEERRNNPEVVEDEVVDEVDDAEIVEEKVVDETEVVDDSEVVEEVIEEVVDEVEEFDNDLNVLLQRILQERYPEIELNISKLPQWESGGNVVSKADHAKRVRYNLSVINALNDFINPKDTKRTRKYGEVPGVERVTIRLNTKARPNLETNLRKALQGKGATNQQIDLVLDHMRANNMQEVSVEDLIASLMAEVSFSVEINTTKTNEDSFRLENELEGAPDFFRKDGKFYVRYEGSEKEEITKEEFELRAGVGFNTEHYKNLSANDEYRNNPDWAYEELEISIPNITPTIKGHAEFSTENGIGWARVWSNKKTGEVHIQEIQSDLFQKGRDLKNLVKSDSEAINPNEENSSPDNQFLQLLNKKGNWVNFFIQALVQDSVKKGYTKVLFPTGETAAKVEGHQTIADSIISLDKRIQQLEEEKIKPLIKYYEDSDTPYILEEDEEASAFGVDSYKSIEEYKDSKQKQINNLTSEKDSIKNNAIEKIEPIEAFYSNRITNTLNKLYDVKPTTDEHGSTWNEIDLSSPKVLSEILLQKNEARQIIGQANIEAMTVLIDASLQKNDTLPHEYAHHYIAWNRDNAIVQEGINKWGSEEALVQAIGEQVVAQKGEALTWWNEFVSWLLGDMNNISTLEKEEIAKILTDAFLTRQDLSASEESKGDINSYEDSDVGDKYDGLSLKKLKDEAKRLGIRGLHKYKAANKPELIELIKEKQAADDQYSLKFSKNARASAVIAKGAAKAIAKKVLDKNNIGKILDYAEGVFTRRRIKRAFVLGSGSERAFFSMLSEKGVDGLVSTTALIDSSKRGAGYFGAAAGLSVFLDDNSSDETFFHENFHIFRDLYGHLEEVEDMMRAVIDQPIFAKIKLQYQENILFAVPTSAINETRVTTQRAALTSLNLKTSERIHSTIEDYSFVTGKPITLELEKEFYDYASKLLTEAQYVELNSDEQTNIQDESLTQLAGIYGAQHQDMFLSDKAKRETYNNSLKSWKEKISKAFTKEEAAWSLEVASKGKYKKTDEFDLEKALAGVKDLMAKHEAEYGRLSTKSPSFRKIDENREDSIMGDINKIVAEHSPEMIKEARNFINNDLPSILNKEELAKGSTVEVMSSLKAALSLNQNFNRAKIGLARAILSNYPENSKERSEVYNVIFNNDKLITNYVEQMFLGAASKSMNDGVSLAEIQAMMAKKALDEVVDQESALSEMIGEAHQEFSDKFYMVVRTFLKADKHIGEGSYNVGIVNKENLMKSIRTLAEKNKTEPKFRLAVENAMEKARRNKSKPSDEEAMEMMMGNFFIFLATEIDMTGGNIFNNILLQFNSMTTESSIMSSGDGFVPSRVEEISRKIRKALHNAGYSQDEMLSKSRDSKAQLKYMRDNYAKIANGEILNDEITNANEGYSRRIDLSKNIARILYSSEGINDFDMIDLINDRFMPKGIEITVKDLDNLVMSEANGNRVSARVYFNKERLEQMLWDSLSIEVNAKEDSAPMSEWEAQAIKEVFEPVFMDYGRKHGNLLKASITGHRAKLKAEFIERFRQSFNTQRLDSLYVPYIMNSLGSFHLSIGKEYVNIDLEESGIDINKGFYEEEEDNTREFFIKEGSAGLVQQIRVKRLSDGSFQAKEVAFHSYGSKTSLNMFERHNGDLATSFNDVQGIKPHVHELLTAKLHDIDDSHNSRVRTPEGEMINMNVRKYFLIYNKESLADYLKNDKTAFASLFSYGDRNNLVMNPYAAMMMNNDYELKYEVFAGDLNFDKDRAEVDNFMITNQDIKEINRAIKNESDFYQQAIRDYSDKTRRYYSRAETIKTIEEAKIKLAELVKYHNNKTEDIISRHNNPRDVFDMHLTTSPEVIAELRALGKTVNTTDNEFDGIKVTRKVKGELNLLGNRAFQLSINGINYDLSTTEGHSDMVKDLNETLEGGGQVASEANELTSLNYFINKFYLQDITSSIMEEQDFTIKNKRASGLIANHDSSYSGGRVELLIFKDESMSSEDMIHKVQVMDYISEEQPDGSFSFIPNLREVSMSADLMDSASYISEDESNRLTEKHGDIVDVKGSFKLVGYGKNVDNKKISSFFGQESNNFYAKGHTIVLNNTVKGPLKVVYKALKAREAYYAKKGLRGHSVLAYASSGIKRGSIDGVKGTPKNKFSLAELEGMTAAQLNKTMNSYSYDKDNQLYGYDGKFFGIQGELDKSSKTATAAKQAISNLNVFKGHSDPKVSAMADRVIKNFTNALTNQYETEIKGMSREDVLRSSMDSDSTPIEVKAAMEDGRFSTPSLRTGMLKLLTSKVQKLAFKIRTGGTLSLQESDVIMGYEIGAANKVVQKSDSLKAMTIEVRTTKLKGSKDITEYYVAPAEAIISQHMAKELGLTKEVVDKARREGKEIRFLATRIPASSSGSTMVLRVAGISTKPGNTIAVNPLVSSIIGSDLDGDSLHLNTIKIAEEGEELSKGDVLKNKLTQSIMDLLLIPSIQNSLTKELEFVTVSKKTNNVMYGNDEGSSEITNDLSILGAHQMFGQTKGNGKMIGLIAAQNLVFSYLSEGNPQLMFGSYPLELTLDGQTKSTLSNSFDETGGGTWYELANWLNLILDDGKNNNRAKFQFVKNTGATFTLLIKMGFPAESISKFLKSAKWAESAEFVFSKTEENKGELDAQLKLLLQNKFPEDSKMRKSNNLVALINSTFSSKFTLDNMDRATSLALYHVMETINGDILKISHFIGLDKHYTAEPIEALSKHHQAVEALERQFNKEEKGIGNKVAEDNDFFKRNKKLNYSLIMEAFRNDPYFSGGYGEALLGDTIKEDELDKGGILNTQKVISKNEEGKDVSKSVGILSGARENKLSTDVEATERIVKALNLTRAAIHSDIDIKKIFTDLYSSPMSVYTLKDNYPPDMWKNMSREERYGATTIAVGQFLDRNIARGGDNLFIKHLNLVHSYAFVNVSEFNEQDEFIKEKPKRVSMYKFKINSDLLASSLDFTEQVRLIQKDFANMPDSIQNFFVANDFVSTGWGSKPGSLLNFFSEEKSNEINDLFKSLEDPMVSEFRKDTGKIFTGKSNLKMAKAGSTIEKRNSNRRRVAIASYLALYGVDESLDSDGLFEITTEAIGSNDTNTVTTVLDNHFTEKEEITNKPIDFYSSMPESAMFGLYADMMSKGEVKKEGLVSNKVGKDQDTRSPDNTNSRRYHKVPVYEQYPNQKQYNIGQKMSPQDFYKAKLEGKLDYEELSDEQKQILDYQYEVYEASLEEVAEMFEEVKSLNMEKTNYSLKHDAKDYSESDKQMLDDRFNKARNDFYNYMQDMSRKMYPLPDKARVGLLEREGEAVVEYKLDELAARPLRRYLEYHFGNHIADKQISDWEIAQGKDFTDTITNELKAKDISSLSMWLSPGDFGKGKPAIAYINKSMNHNHKTYTRNIHLITQEMNDKLNNLFILKFGDTREAKAKRLWMKYMGIGSNSISSKLFENLIEVTTELKEIVEADSSVSYRDGSNINLKSGFFHTREGKNKNEINEEGTAFQGLKKAEQEYLKMYVTYTSFYRELISNKNLYDQDRGGKYVPAYTSDRWETLHKRGLFGMYFQLFKGDEAISDVIIEDINPITGETQKLDYFSWKAIYMSDSSANITTKTNRPDGSSVYVTSEEGMAMKQTSVERIAGLERIKEKAKQYVKNGRDADNNDVSVGSRVNDVMNLESEESRNRYNSKKSMTSAYLATENLHKSLRNYVSTFMFQHGNTFLDEETNVYKNLHYSKEDREFRMVELTPEEAKSDSLAFTGFEDKKQEIDAAIANLGSGKYFDTHANIGNGQNKNAINYLNKVVKSGLISKERGLSFSDFEHEASITSFFVNWTMYVALGFNGSAAVGNAAIGKYNAYRQMGGKKMLMGEARYWGLSKEKGYDDPMRVKARKMIEEFGILTYRAEEIAEGTGGSSLSSIVFLPMVVTENWIQQAAFLGSLTEEQWDSYEVSDKGDLELKPGAKGISKDDLSKLERDVINVQGRGYSETDSRMIQLYALSNMTMQFKRWFPTFMKDRFGKDDIDDLGTMRIGSFTAAADFLTKMREEDKLWDIRKFKKELKAYGEEHGEHKKDAVMRVWRGTKGIMVIAMLLGIAGKASDDDEKDEAELYLEKLLGDMLLVVNVPKLTYMANFPAINTFKNLGQTVGKVVSGTEYKRKSKYGDAGDKSYISNLAQLIPSSLRGVLAEGDEKKSRRTIR